MMIAGKARKTTKAVALVMPAARGRDRRENAGYRGQGGPDRPGDREDPSDVDALRLRGLLIEGGGPHRHSQAAAKKPGHEAETKQGHADRDDLGLIDEDVANLMNWIPQGSCSDRTP